MSAFLLTTIMSALLICGGAWAGEIHIRGGAVNAAGRIGATTLAVAPGARLSGNGRIAGDCLVAGTLAPGDDAGNAVGLLTVEGTVSFVNQGAYSCTVMTHTNLDRLVCSGFSGACGIAPVRAPAAIPVRQPVIVASSSANYSNTLAIGPAANRWRLDNNGQVLLLTDGWGDSDGDDLPDYWELDHFSGRTNAIAGADGDGDHADNTHEYLAGTNPTNDASVFRILSVSRVSSNQVEISWPAADGRSYDLYTGTSITNCVVLVESNLVGDGACTVTEDRPSGKQFYRATATYPGNE